MTKVVHLLLILGVLAVSPASAQLAWDISGNSTLTGTYNFRQVYYQTSDAKGDLGTGYALYGTLSFDGNGHYTIANGTIASFTSGAGTTKTYSTTGTYSISASGYGFLSGLNCPFSGGCGTNNTVYVLVSKGVVLGSSPENVNDIFIATQVTATPPTDATFSGAWTLAGYIPSISSAAGSSSDAFFQVNPDGAGNLGSVSVTGYFGSSTNTQTTQTASSVQYSFNNGVATVVFPTSTSTSYFFSGTQNLYFSPDGNFVFGGSTSFPNLIVGVRNPANGTTQTLNGIYYVAGVDENEYFLPQYGIADFDTYYGSFNATGGNILEADRMQAPANVSATNTTGAITATSAYTYPATPFAATYTTTGITQYAVSANGAYRIGAGIGPYLSFSVAVQAPTLTGTGVYLNPQGITNAGSFAPFTAGISPGEIISLFGSGLASSAVAASSLPLPTSLGSVQVSINGRFAPIYYVSPGLISVLVPYETAGPIAQIQVTNGTSSSSVITTFVRTTSPGVITIPSGGIGPGAFEHADGTLISTTSPAQPGEYIVAYLSGLGAVTPATTDGAAASSTTHSTTNVSFTPFIGYAQATNVIFSGLTPTLAGLYQVNLQVPTTAPPGNVFFELDGPDSQTTEATISIASGATSATTPATPAVKPHLTGWHPR